MKTDKMLGATSENVGPILWDMIVPIHPSAGNNFGILERFADSGYGYVSLTLAGDDVGVSGATKKIARARAEILGHPSKYVFVETVADILEAKREGKLAVGINLEGTRCIDRDLYVLDAFYKLGIRHALLSFNLTNDVGGGCAEPNDGGLTPFGRCVVTRMNQIGMILDLSHTGYKTSMDALEVTQSPSMFSHSNACGVFEHYRNVRDDQIEACARTGGVIGLSGSSVYLGSDAPLCDLIVRHVDYICDLVGPDYVGLGTDYVVDPTTLYKYFEARPYEWPTQNGEPWEVPQYAPPEEVSKISETLSNRGYSDADVNKIMGQNFLRVAQAVWK